MIKYDQESVLFRLDCRKLLKKIKRWCCSFDLFFYTLLFFMFVVWVREVTVYYFG